MNSYADLKEGASLRYRVSFVDFDEVAIPDNALLSIEMTLYDEDTGAIINERSSIDVYNAGPGTVDAETGVLTLVLTPDDMPVLSGSEEEWHVLLLRYTYSDGVNTLTGVTEARLGVQKITNLPA